MKYSRLVLISLAALALCACNKTFHYRGNDYHYSENGPILNVPADLNRKDISRFYYVSEPTGDKNVSMAPPGSLAAKQEAMAPAPSVRPPALPRTKLALGESNGKPILMIKQPIHTAWSMVGSVMHYSHYHIIDANDKLNAYVIADVAQTHGKLEKDTPIVWVHLHPVHGYTQVYVSDQQQKLVSRKVSNRILRDLKRQIADFS